MSFILSKLVWGLFAPMTLLFLALTSGWLLLGKAPRLSRALLGLCSLFLTLLLLTPVGNWAIAPLESRFPQPTLDAAPIDGIIILGGAIDATASQATGTIVLNDAAERMTEGLALARRHPEAKLVFTGGSSSVRDDAREADVAKSFLQQQGLDVSRVVFERDSRNTYENAVESKRLVQPRAREHWLLVTSAFHMPRSVGCFRTVGWNVIPYPVDFRAQTEREWLHFSGSAQLSLLSTAAREYIGLLSYWLMGRIADIYSTP